MQWIVARPSRMFLFALVWGMWMMFVGAIPHFFSGSSLPSLTFEYRDYLLRLFVVFLVGHLFVRQTNLKLLFAIPLITLALWQGIDVYDFSEWYSRTHRVNLHELNAQLFVVPVQVAVLAVGVYFCCRSHLRTTTRLFATIMLAGSILSTLGFHLSIVNVTYKPVERVYSAQIKGAAKLDDFDQACTTLKSDCRVFDLGSLTWGDQLDLDPQLPLAHREMFPYLMANHAWVRNGNGPERFAGLASVSNNGVRVAEVRLPLEFYAPAMDYVFAGGECPEGYRCWQWSGSIPADIPSSEMVGNVITSLSSSPTFLHNWAHAAEFTDSKPVPAFFAAGRREGGDVRLAVGEMPRDVMARLSRSLAGSHSCDADRCEVLPLDGQGVPVNQTVAQLLEQARKGSYEDVAKLWVDKALSRNPVLYINRPEFLRYYIYRDGMVRLITSPLTFSDITLDLKITFNLIIGIFSCAWLTLGVFLILFHTRRQLAKA